MNKAKIIKVLIFSFLLISILIVIKGIQKPPIIKKIDKVDETTIDSGKSNVINEVSYQSQDINGNKYLINALKGEIDLSNSDTIFLTNVSAQIDLKNSNSILISSDFGKYNIKNFDTIFSKNVTIFYLNSKIIGDYLDFSIDRSSMVISRNLVYTNNKNILKKNVVEEEIKTKEIKIFMDDEKKKVKLQNIK